MNRTTTALAIAASTLLFASTPAFGQQPIIHQVEADYTVSASATAGPWSSSCSHDEHVEEFPAGLRCGFSEDYYDEETGEDSAASGEAAAYCNASLEGRSLLFWIHLEADGTSYGNAGGGGSSWMNAGVLFELPYKADVRFDIERFEGEFASCDFEVFSQANPNSPIELEVGANGALRLAAGMYVLRLEGEAYGDPTTDWAEAYAEIRVTPSWLDTPAMRADIDGNGMVDGQDLAKVLAGFGSEYDLADLDRSGWVDGTDLAILLGAWGPVENAEQAHDFDVNNDGVVDDNDMLLVLVHIQTGMYSEDADINNDGVVDQEDFDLITEELQG